MNWKQMFNKKNKIIRIIQKYNVKKYSGKSQASSISDLKELYKKNLKDWIQIHPKRRSLLYFWHWLQKKVKVNEAILAGDETLGTTKFLTGEAIHRNEGILGVPRGHIYSPTGVCRLLWRDV